MSALVDADVAFNGILVTTVTAIATVAVVSIISVVLLVPLVDMLRHLSIIPDLWFWVIPKPSRDPTEKTGFDELQLFIGRSYG